MANKHKKEVENATKFFNALQDNDYQKSEKLLKRKFTPCRRTFHQIFSRGHIAYLKLLLKYRHDIYHLYGNYAIQISSENGHTEMVKILLENQLVDPSVGDDYSLTTASELGHIDVVELLLNDERVDATTENNSAIRSSFINGFVGIAYMLWKKEEVKTTCESAFSDNEYIFFISEMKKMELFSKVDHF